MSACRGGRSRRADRKGAHRVTERDRAIISVVALHGAASRAQLMALGHFTSVSRANRRLSLLCDAKFLRRTYIATGPHQNETIYVPGSAGSSIAAEDCNLDPTELKRQGQRMPERMYLEHHLGVLEVRLLAEQVSGDVRLTQYLAEPECRHEYEVVAGSRSRRRLIKPDAVAIFEQAGSELPIFIEFDRGHVSLPQMSGVFDRYGSYWTEEAFQCAYETTAVFTVAIVTTAGQRRIDHLKELALRSPVPIKFTTFNELRDQGFLGQVWQRAGNRDRCGLWEPQTQGGVGP